MELLYKVLRPVRELGPVFLVAVAVVAVGTVSAAVFNYAQKAGAEEQPTREVAAVPASDGRQQVLMVKEWGVTLTVPLAAEMPLMSYASQSAVSVGLSTADLKAYGKECSAARGGLGSLVRIPAGTFGEYSKGDVSKQFVKTLGGYDYLYLAPEKVCVDSYAVSMIMNREKSVLYEALSTLTAQ